MSTANNLFNASEIEQLKAGATISKVLTDSPELGAKPTVTSVKVHTDEELSNSANWGSAPRVSAPGASEKIKGAKSFIGDDGKEHSISKVVAPNIDRYNQQAAARALKDIELREAADAAQQQLDPASINSTLQALSRKVARLEKQLKEAKADG